MAFSEPSVSLPHSREEGVSGATQRLTMGPRQFGQGVWCLVLPRRAKRWETGWLAALMEGWRRSCYVGVDLLSQSLFGDRICECLHGPRSSLEQRKAGVDHHLPRNYEKNKQPGGIKRQQPSSKKLWVGEPWKREQGLCRTRGRTSPEGVSWDRESRFKGREPAYHHACQQSTFLFFYAKGIRTLASVWGKRVKKDLAILIPLPAWITIWKQTFWNPQQVCALLLKAT